MEETIWIFIGIISVLLVFGILADFFGKKSDESKLMDIQQALDSLTNMCNRVCALPVDTYLSVGAKIPSGIRMEINDTAICMHHESLSCKPCDCRLEHYELDLTFPEAKKLFRTHTYRCFFLRGDISLSVECQG